jgi:hypothetical protein
MRHQLLAYTDDMNLLGHNTATLIDACKEVGIKVNIEELKYMLMSLYQNAGQNWDMKTGNRSCENVSQFKYLGTIVTYQNLN